MYPYLGGSVPMQQSLKPFDGTDPTYTIEDFLNSITTNLVMAAVPVQTDSPNHEALILKSNCHDTNGSNRTTATMVLTPSTRDKKELASTLPRVPKNIS